MSVEFSKQQLDYIEDIMKTEILTVINKEIKENYIPRILVEEMLKLVKEQKREITSLQRKLFIDGCIYALEEVLKKEANNE